MSISDKPTSSDGRSGPTSQTVDMGHKRPDIAQRAQPASGRRTPSVDLATERHETIEVVPSSVYRIKRKKAFSDALLGVTGDFGADKEGKMSPVQADQVESKFMQNLVSVGGRNGGQILGSTNERDRTAFLAAVYAYLALNTGSSNAEDGFNVADGASMIEWPGGSMPATDIRTSLGNGTYRYMRARASEISDVIALMYQRASKKPDDFPGAVEFVNNMNVVAEKRGMSEYPTYAAIGAEYIERVPPKIKARIMEAAANVLNSRPHSRDVARDAAMSAVGGAGMASARRGN